MKAPTIGRTVGTIAAGNPQTVAAAAAALRQGGNAVDAAVAASFASFMAEIGVAHMGGSGIAQVYDPQAGRSVVYDFFSTMPGLEAREQIRELDFERVTVDYGSTTQDFYLGRGSVAVPGNIYGLCRLASDHGRLPLPDLLEPALALARQGAVLDDFQAATCELLRPLYMYTAGMRAIFAPDGRMIRSGDRLIIPHLATTLEALATKGMDLIRKGHLAQTLVADHTQNGGLLGIRDLQAYKVQSQAPIRIDYRENTVLLPPPCSTGGVLTAFSLSLLAGFSLRQMAHGSAHHLRLLYEVMAATARARPFWEKAAAQRPPEEAVDTFLDEDFVRPFAKEVREALNEQRPSTAPPEASGPSNTTHVSVVDDHGMAVALTTTAGESAGYVVPQTGFIPNNILGEADLNPDGFHRWQPGQRLPTMMTPTIVLRDGQIRLVTGSGGSNRIRSAILQILTNALDFDMPLQDAVDAPRVHVEQGTLQCEYGHDEAALDQLEELGYPVNRWAVRSIYFGGAHSIARGHHGELDVAGDERRGGATASL